MGSRGGRATFCSSSQFQRLQASLRDSRSDTKVRQELLLIQHLFQELDKTLFRGHGQKLSVSFSFFCLESALSSRNVKFRGHTLDVGNVPRRDIRPVFNKPVHPLFESWESLNVSWLENQRRVKRHETNKRPDWQLLRVTVTPLNGIVVEAVLLVPERQGIGAAGVGHSIRDEQEVLKELVLSVTGAYAHSNVWDLPWKQCPRMSGYAWPARGQCSTC